VSRDKPSLVNPLTRRLFDALPGSTVAVGASFAVVLLVLFFTGRELLDGAAGSTAGDLRLAIIHILLTAHAAFAYAFLLMATRRAAQDLAPAFEHTPEVQAAVEQVGRHSRLGLVCAALVLILIYLYATEITTTDTSPWVWSTTNYDSRWMRIIGPWFAMWTGCFLYAMVVDSARLSRLTETIASLDLLDLRPYEPLVRLGLINALLVVGMAAVLSFFLLEPGFVGFITFSSIVFAVYAWIGLMLPLRGIRKQISMAKHKELDWCRQALQTARGQLKAGDEAGRSLVEISAYKEQIESIRNWPFDNPTLIRFALYLLIPLGSMFGGAFVEKGLELFVF
jgi:hypothetical protein